MVMGTLPLNQWGHCRTDDPKDGPAHPKFLLALLVVPRPQDYPLPPVAAPVSGPEAMVHSPEVASKRATFRSIFYFSLFW